MHVRDTGYVPVVKRLVEDDCIGKHASHVRDTGYVPTIEGVVEGPGKEKTHIGYCTYAPAVNWAIGSCVTSIDSSLQVILIGEDSSTVAAATVVHERGCALQGCMYGQGGWKELDHELHT